MYSVVLQRETREIFQQQRMSFQLNTTRQLKYFQTMIEASH